MVHEGAGIFFMLPPLTLHFRIEVPQEYPTVGISLSGSLRELGSFSRDRLVKLGQVETGSWEYTCPLGSIVPFFQYQFVLHCSDGQTYADIRRTFRVPEDRISSLTSRLGLSGRLSIHLLSKFGDDGRTSVRVFVPENFVGVPSAPTSPSLVEFQSMIEDLQRENKALREDVQRLSSIIESPPQSPVNSGENEVMKQLLGEINNLRGKVHVVGRFRPLMSFEPEGMEYGLQKNPDGTSGVFVQEKFAASQTSCRQYTLDEVFDEFTTNESLFSSCNLQELMECAVILQSNVCVFCYGQTGSGKSHTMLGTVDEPGIISMSIDSVFAALDRISHREIEIEIFEIYLDQIFSILGRCHVASRDEIMELYNDAITGRATASTAINETSSRSHFVLILSVFDPETSVESEIFFVDLAGSERTKITNAQGDRLMEANSINKSLSTLGLVLNGLLQNAQFIPFRDSRLTKVLAPVFTRTSPPSRVLMIANLSPNAEDQRETLSTLGFAQRVAKVEMRELKRDHQVEELIAHKEQELENARYKHR
jgi:hypothetical protein